MKTRDTYRRDHSTYGLVDLGKVSEDVNVRTVRKMNPTLLLPAEVTCTGAINIWEGRKMRCTKVMRSVYMYVFVIYFCPYIVGLSTFIKTWRIQLIFLNSRETHQGIICFYVIESAVFLLLSIENQIQFAIKKL